MLFEGMTEEEEKAVRLHDHRKTALDDALEAFAGAGGEQAWGKDPPVPEAICTAAAWVCDLDGLTEINDLGATVMVMKPVSLRPTPSDSEAAAGSLLALKPNLLYVSLFPHAFDGFVQIVAPDGRSDYVRAADVKHGDDLPHSTGICFRRARNGRRVVGLSSFGQ